MGREQGEVQQGQAWVGFESAFSFDFENAIVTVDDDFDYGEERLKAIGVISRGEKLCRILLELADQTLSERKLHCRQGEHRKKLAPSRKNIWKV